MSSLSEITFNSTLEDLTSCAFQVDSHTPGQIVAQEFHQNPELPGVIVVDDGKVMGMISRTNFREQMSHLNRKTFYLSQPIQLLLDIIRIPPLILSKYCSILVAANQVLTRPKHLVYEPIVIESDTDQFQILDIHHLLIAQNQLLNLSYHQIEQRNLQLKKCEQNLKREQRKVQKHELSLQKRTHLIYQKYNKDYNKRQAKLSERIQPIVQLNQNFIRASERILAETSKAFHSIVLNANSTYHNTENSFKISNAIAEDLDAINSTSLMLEDIIQKVRHLAVQAAVFTYHADSSQPQGFSQIGFEVNRLVSETSKVSDQINSIATQLKFHLQELRESVVEDARIACSMVSHVERAEAVIADLEQLVNLSVIHHNDAQSHSNDAQHLMKVIDRVLQYADEPQN
ncbi:MAG: chemotaxis protein [Cyanobacteriota bacterium]|nr:chemotaxis protein [Cyanobacteriota bacterium]